MTPKVEQAIRRELPTQPHVTSYPGLDDYLLALLSRVIATLGLLVDSDETVTGATLVAPWMSPILGSSLCAIWRDETLRRDTVSAPALGGMLSMASASLLTFLNLALPVIPLVPARYCPPQSQQLQPRVRHQPQCLF